MMDPRKLFLLDLVLTAAAWIVLPSSARAWDNHGLITQPALEDLPVLRQAAPVAAETFGDFLMATQQGLIPLLEEEEVWARANVPAYAPRPDGLRWQSPRTPADVHASVMAALRLNPLMQLPLYRTHLPRKGLVPASPISAASVSVIPASLSHVEARLERLAPGTLIAPLDILVTAVDEPDFGLDIGLWEDNGTDFGSRYGFGPQPFGNPQLEFSSQAPFHMGFYFEDEVIYKAAPFLNKTYPEMRIHQFASLARFAFKEGHPYWGYRFLGWGLHYLQDLTQPYHATVLPGVSTVRMLLINALALVGWEGPKNDAIQLVSNRHLALENFQCMTMIDAYENTQLQHPLLAAARKAAAEPRQTAYSDSYPRSVVARSSHQRARQLDHMLTVYLPSQLVDDPNYIFSVTDPDIDVAKVLAHAENSQTDNMVQLLSPLLATVGAHSRIFVAHVLDGAGSPQK